MSEQQLPIKGNLTRQSFIESLDKENGLMLKDSWDGEKDLGIRVNQHTRDNNAIHFSNIYQKWFRDAVKRYVLYRRNQGKSFATLVDSVKVLRYFSRFLEDQCICSFEDIAYESFSNYLTTLKNLSQRTQQNRITHLKHFFETGNINGWFNVPTYWFKGQTSRIKPNGEEINYIPYEVLQQLEENFYLLAKPLQRMLVLFRTLGLRAGELLQMKFDCWRQRKNGEWEIHFTNWKFDKRHDILPIIPELAEVIKEQQAYIRTHLGEEFQYLFCANTCRAGKFKPQPKIMTLQSFNDYLNKLAEQCNICDKTGNRWRFTSHQFRRTVATKMTNEGVRQYIIQRYLRHDNPDMMQHYASIFPATIKQEMVELHKQKKIVDVTGTEVSLNHPELEDEAGLQWLRSKMQPKALAMGFCARPQLLKPCPHANACLSCNHYRLDGDDLPALRQHLERNQKLKKESERLGYVRQLKGIEEDTTKLMHLIKALENNNG